MTLHKFAVVVGSDVAGTIAIDDSRTETAVPRFIAAYYSDPRIVPIPEELTEVEFGWSYDGDSFIPPAGA